MIDYSELYEEYIKTHEESLILKYFLVYLQVRHIPLKEFNNVKDEYISLYTYSFNVEKKDITSITSFISFIEDNTK